MTNIGTATRVSPAANALQILLVFLVAAVIVWTGWMVVGNDPFKRQAVVWVANVAMLVTVWIGLRVRHQTWAHLGLARGPAGRHALIRTALQSMGVMVFSLVAFVAGTMLTASFAGAAQGSDMSGYEYLRGNLPMLLLALLAVYVVSSCGEEVVYRGFLMTRLAEIGEGTTTAWAASAVISAIVFGLAHFDWGFVGIVQTTFMGSALGVSYLLVGRNLWVLVLAHAYIDTLLLWQLYLGPAVPHGQ